MVCYKPLSAQRQLDGSIKILKRDPHYLTGRKHPDDDHLYLPCGQCVGCRLERSRQWAVRCMHEASLYENNSFITLTYDNDHLPDDLSLDVTHYQKFMKRLRKRFGSGIRFFHCGEYGETYYRPHYHACLFNFDFPDKKLFKIQNGCRLYTSDILSELWPFGFSTIGDVTFESAAYVARYIMKKVTGKDADKHYKGRKPEYTTMSRRPGLGKGWLDKFVDDVYTHDHVIVRNKKTKPPRFYDNQYEILCPDEMEALKLQRMAKAGENLDNLCIDRLAVKEYIKKDRIKNLVRTVDKEL